MHQCHTLFKNFKVPFSLLIISLWLVGCSHKNECNYEYHNFSKSYCVIGQLSNNKENSLFEFYDNKKVNEFSEVGFFQDGFRNDKWQYKMGNKLQTIIWNYYKDKYLDFETNTFANADSTKYGPYFTKLKFSNEFGAIILGISINSPLRDSFPERNYERIVRSEFERINVKVVNVKSRIIHDSLHTIFLHEFFVKSLNGDSDKNVIIENLFCKLDEHQFVELSVRFDEENTFFGQKLFDAVLTNSYFNKTRLYFPFKKVN